MSFIIYDLCAAVCFPLFFFHSAGFFFAFFCLFCFLLCVCGNAWPTFNVFMFPLLLVYKTTVPSLWRINDTNAHWRPRLHVARPSIPADLPMVAQNIVYSSGAVPCIDNRTWWPFSPLILVVFFVLFFAFISFGAIETIAVKLINNYCSFAWCHCAKIGRIIE